MTPRFSIIVPTREGADTLGATLRTCLAQTFDDYEIIVSDNFSSPAVREVVDSLASPKIKYFRTDKRLAITPHWDFAMSKACGEYVTILGSDDGLLFHALAAVDNLIRTTKLKAIRWQRVQYTWPSYISKVDANLLWLPFTRDHRYVDGRAMLSRVMALEASYGELPMLYNACVHRTMLDEMRLRTGAYFFGRSPDVYSAIAVAYMVGSYLSVDAPMSINGGSGNSNGAAHLFQWDTNPIAREFDELNRAFGIEPHAWVPDLLYFPEGPVADAFLRVKERLFPGDPAMCLDRKLFVTRWVDGIRARSEAEWHEVRAKIRATLSDSSELQEWFDTTFANRQPEVKPLLRVFSPYRGFDGESLTLTADRLGIRDVFEAARVCEELLNYSKDEISYCIPSYNRLRQEHDYLSQQCKALEMSEKRALTLDDQLQQLQAEYDGYRSRFGHRVLDRIGGMFAWLRWKRKATKAAEANEPQAVAG